MKGMTPLQKTLRISVDARGRLMAAVSYRNLADFDVFVPKEQPTIFVESEGKEIEDIGPSEKREPYTIDDYIRLAPGRHVEGQIDMTDLYAWKPGSHVYEGSITGNYTDPVDGRAWKGERVRVQFRWKK